jgi:hypothetical protein
MNLYEKSLQRIWLLKNIFTVSSYNKIVQIIRVQVQKQAPKLSNFRTWTHIIPVINRNHEGFQTNSITTKIASFDIRHHTLHFTSSSEQAYNTSESQLLHTKFWK